LYPPEKTRLYLSCPCSPPPPRFPTPFPIAEPEFFYFTFLLKKNHEVYTSVSPRRFFSCSQLPPPPLFPLGFQLLFVIPFPPPSPSTGFLVPHISREVGCCFPLFLFSPLVSPPPPPAVLKLLFTLSFSPDVYFNPSLEIIRPLSSSALFHTRSTPCVLPFLKSSSFFFLADHLAIRS